jgi:hypothetical protein
MSVDSPTGRPWMWGVVFTLVFGVLGTVVAYYGIQESPANIPTAKSVAEQPGPVKRIELPHDDTPIPAGPHRDEFRVACTTCHSARLVFTQPRLAKEKWDAVVLKMVDAYKAPLSTKEERNRIVAYLVSVHGK